MTHFIEVENKFEMTRGDILVRRKSYDGTREEQRVRFPADDGDRLEKRRKVNLSLEGDQDYLEIIVDNQRDELGPCKIDICSNGPVTFIPPAAASVTVNPSEDVETITTLRIPSGPPTWKLDIMMPPTQSSQEGYPESISIPREGSQTNVTVGDDEPGGWS